MTVDELGSSTIVLLPSCNTNFDCVVGEISVSSAVGTVIMNQAFQATVVPSPYSNPMRPVARISTKCPTIAGRANIKRRSKMGRQLALLITSIGTSWAAMTLSYVAIHVWGSCIRALIA